MTSENISELYTKGNVFNKIFWKMLAYPPNSRYYSCEFSSFCPVIYDAVSLQVLGSASQRLLNKAVQKTVVKLPQIAERYCNQGFL